jgi:hypothetical protein
MFDIVEGAHLRKGAQEWLSIFVVAKSNGFGPVVGPLDHGARFEVIVSKLVQMSTAVCHFVSHMYLRPITEIKSIIA